MEKNTILAIVLSMVVIFGTMILQNVFFPPQAVEETSLVENNGTAEEEVLVIPQQGSSRTPIRVVESTEDREAAVDRGIMVETDLYEIRFQTRGARVDSLILKEHREGDSQVQMVFRPENSPQEAFFDLAFGQGEDLVPLSEVFYYENEGNEHRFYQDFLDLDDRPFRLTKVFTLHPGEYMLEVDVEIESLEDRELRLADEGVYTLMVGPQIGPSFEKLDQRQDFRRNYFLEANSRREFKVNDEWKLLDKAYSWASITGKYFLVAGIPSQTGIEVSWQNRQLENSDMEFMTMGFSQDTLRGGRLADHYRFYVGPKEESVLARYNNAENNSLGISGLRLDKLTDSNWFTGWLEWILRNVLVLLHSVVRNWGVAIIVMTLLIKGLLYPLTKKSHQATAEMQSLQPKIKELQEKYKDDSAKLNTAMAELYQKEGVSPLGGCLPMILQIPIFLSMYNLFNNHFSLRGAGFIPGWINDLSQPESIFSLGFELPFLGSEIRLLPVLMVGTQMLMSKFTTGATAATGQMKMMTYAMPLVFFFILYNMPSGLLLYWTVTNLLTAIQQSYINKHRHAPAAPAVQGKNRSKK